MKKFDDFAVGAFAKGDAYRGFVGFAGDFDVFGFYGDFGTGCSGAFDGGVAIAGTQCKVDDGPFRFGFVCAVGENFEIISIPSVEHDGASFAFAPGDLFLKSHRFGVKFYGCVKVVGANSNVVKASAPDGFVLRHDLLLFCVDYCLNYRKDRVR